MKKRRILMTCSTLRATCLLTVVLVLALAATPSFASSITIFNTGAGLSGSGQTDTHYQLILAPLNVPATLLSTPVYPGWVAASPGSWWINSWGVDNASTPVTPPQYVYETTFSLVGLYPMTAILTGKFAADNDACIFLNSSPTGACTPFNTGFKQLTPFTIGPNSRLFLPGTNKLDFKVNNYGVATGLTVEISGTASPTPEPASLIMFGSGVLGLGGFLRRRLLG